MQQALDTPPDSGWLAPAAAAPQESMLLPARRSPPSTLLAANADPAMQVVMYTPAASTALFLTDPAA